MFSHVEMTDDSMWPDFDIYCVHNFSGLWSLTCKGDGGVGGGGCSGGGVGGDYDDDYDCIHNICSDLWL